MSMAKRWEISSQGGYTVAKAAHEAPGKEVAKGPWTSFFFSFLFNLKHYCKHSAGGELIHSDKQFCLGKTCTFPLLVAGDGEHEPQGSTGEATG